VCVTETEVLIHFR